MLIKNSTILLLDMSPTFLQAFFCNVINMNYGAVMTTLFVYACYLSYDNIFCVETILIIRIYFVH